MSGSSIGQICGYIELGNPFAFVWFTLIPPVFSVTLISPTTVCMWYLGQLASGLKPWKWEFTLYNVPPQHNFFRLLIFALYPHFIVVLGEQIILEGVYAILNRSGD